MLNRQEQPPPIIEAAVLLSYADFPEKVFPKWHYAYEILFQLQGDAEWLDFHGASEYNQCVKPEFDGGTHGITGITW